MEAGIFFGVAHFGRSMRERLAVLAQHRIAFGPAIPLQRPLTKGKKKRMPSVHTPMREHERFVHKAITAALQEVAAHAQQLENPASYLNRKIAQYVDQRIEEFITITEVCSKLGIDPRRHPMFLGAGKRQESPSGMPAESRKGAEQAEREKAAADKLRKQNQAEQQKAADEEARRVLSPAELRVAESMALSPRKFLEAKRRRAVGE